MKPFSQACENNREPILTQLREHFAEAPHVLEIGSGTGQHAVFFAAHLPHLFWQTSDLPDRHAGIQLWLDEAGLDNLGAPLSLDVRADWPPVTVHSVFSANTAHIMAETGVAAMFAGVGARLAADGCFVLYGPFNRDGEYTSPSNAAFNAHLTAQDPAQGLRDDRMLIALAGAHDMHLAADVEMPANNRLLVWRRGAALRPRAAQALPPNA